MLLASAVVGADDFMALDAMASTVKPIDPLKPWLQFPVMTRARLSRDGRHLAAIGIGGGLPLAYVLDLKTQEVTPLTPVTRQAGERFREGIYPDDVRWVGDGLLIVTMAGGYSQLLTPDGERVFKLGGYFIARLSPTDDGAERILVGADGALRILNLRTRTEVRYDIGLPNANDLLHYALDEQGRLRAATTYKASSWSGEQVIRQWYRVDEKSDWQLLETHADFDAVWEPLRVLPDGEGIVVRARGDRDVRGIYRYDVARRQLGELMAGHASDDVLPPPSLDQNSFRQVTTNGLKPRVFWFDADWARLQASVDAALPGALNLLSGRTDGHVLVASSSDVDPGRWFVLDTQTTRMREVGVSMPGIDPARMRPMQTLRYAARDGLSIPAYLTRPAGEGPAPMVVLIHGGPWSRDTWGWDVEVQMLAAEGYAVFQPQFRGSTGFGRAFEAAGYRQWGLAMQDDITDGVQHLIDQGVADPARVAIVGASYGGYAAMWGLVKTPRLYRCGVSFAGISDLVEHLDNHWTDDSTAASREIARRLVGDRKTARAALETVSPLHHARRIEAPLLLVHGERDKRVLPAESERMLKAMQRLGKQVEWLPLPESGHGLFYDVDKRRYFGTLLAFLRQHLTVPT